MRIRIVIQDFEAPAHTAGNIAALKAAAARQHHVEVWSGDIDIQNDNVYITKISLIAEGEPRPICDIPFSLNVGYWMWIPADGMHESETEEVSYMDAKEVAYVEPTDPQTR